MADAPYQSLYRRYRPQRFAEVLGQDHVVLALRNAVRDGRAGHAYLFSGPRGTGKTSVARILAKALNCAHQVDGEPDGTCESCLSIQQGTSLDVHELDAASNNGVDAMRDLVSRAALGTPGRWKVYIVDEVHMLSTAASNALLKTLEEPPAHVIFVLATTDPQKVLPTIRSRTQHFEFRLLPPELLATLVHRINADANLQVPGEALDLVVRRGRGSARDTLSVLDQVAAAGVVDDEAEIVDEIVEALCERDTARALVALAEACNSGRDPQRVAVDLLEHLRNGFLAIMAKSLVPLPDNAVARIEAQARRLGAPALVRAMEAIGAVLTELRDAPEPRVAVEVALVRLTKPELSVDVASLVERIERLENGAGPSGPPAPSRASRPEPESQRAARGRPAPQDPRQGTGVGGPEARSQAQAVPARPAPSQPGGGGRPTLGALRGRPSGPTAASSGPVQQAAMARAPQPSAEQAPPASPNPSGELPTRDRLVQTWGDVLLDQLPQKARPRYRSGRFVDVRDGKAVFAVANDIHRDRCNDVRNEVEAVLAQHFGVRVPLEIIVDGADSAAAVMGEGRPIANVPSAEQLPDEEDVDMSETVDGGPVAVASPAERVMQAFPGAEEVS